MTDRMTDKAKKATGAPKAGGDGSPAALCPHIAGPADFARAFGVSRETTDRLEAYAGLLRRWQKTINLVAPRTLDEIWHRHFADSAQLVRLIPPDARRLADLGSGAGFPGMVIAILAAETGHALTALRVTLIESDTRKAAFLREVARTLGIAVDIIPARIESDTIRAIVERIDCVTSRALAPLPRLFELAHPYFDAATVALFLKGRDVGSEIEDAEHHWSFALRLEPSCTEPDARIAVITDLEIKKGS